jgi:uncharacterized protein involved in exopolysaccharide biosynthesis
VLGLHLERNGEELRLWDPASGQWLPTPQERAEMAEAELDRERQDRERAESQVEKLQQQIEELQRRLSAKP